MKTLARNKRTRFDYEILQTFEAGLVLQGQEVKSIKLGHASLKGSYVTFIGEELFLKNATISPYKFAGKLTGYDPTRSRKILVHKKELASLRGKTQTQGLTLVPLSVYTKRGLVKLSFALAKGKKRYDKRETIKRREDERAIGRALKQRR
jgi:SsrA-binding protein